MPRRTDIKKVMVIGSGPIVIGQAAEFDYAGTQACLALKEEGYEVILVNSNPATIMTDTNIADKVYMEPLTLEYVAKIVRYERPDAIVPGLGGQTGLNLAVQLAKKGILEECGHGTRCTDVTDGDGVGISKLLGYEHHLEGCVLSANIKTCEVCGALVLVVVFSADEENLLGLVLACYVVVGNFKLFKEFRSAAHTLFLPGIVLETVRVIAFFSIFHSSNFIRIKTKKSS